MVGLPTLADYLRCVDSLLEPQGQLPQEGRVDWSLRVGKEWGIVARGIDK